MNLFHNEDVLKTYDISLGFAPIGPKQVEGDGKTPEGRYYIDRRNPNSAFHLSLGISYPNEEDIAYAASMGLEAGGDIFIHGQPNGFPGLLPRAGDWTEGCIAVTNAEMEELWRVADLGTEVRIRP